MFPIDNIKKPLPALLILCCLVLLVATVIDLSVLVSAGRWIVRAGEADELPQLLILYFVCSAVPFVGPQVFFIQFVLRVIRLGEFFSKRQSRNMFGISIFLLFRVILEFAVPSLGAFNEFGHIFDDWTIPSVNLTIVAFAIMFLALGFVFEYGRRLQEDADDIL